MMEIKALEPALVVDGYGLKTGNRALGVVRKIESLSFAGVGKTKT
jgi:hypothetical protein